MTPELHEMGIIVNPAGPGKQVPVLEKMIENVKSTIRSFQLSNMAYRTLCPG
jgi:hypothetical protein